MKEFIDCAEAMLKVKLPSGTIGISSEPGFIMTIHMSEPAMLEKFRPEEFSCEDRICAIYPYKYSIVIHGVKFFFISTHKLPSVADYDEVAVEYDEAQLDF